MIKTLKLEKKGTMQSMKQISQKSTSSYLKMKGYKHFF